MSAGIFSSAFKYYWLAICIFATVAFALWYCKCRRRGRQRHEEMLARQRILIQQLQLEEAAIPPSRYHSDAPPAYDDVINKPEDYPIYHAQATSTSFTPGSPPAIDASQDTQTLPSYEEVIGLSGNITESAPPNVPEENELMNNINMQNLRTSDL